MVETNYRKTLIKILTFLGGIYFFLEFVLPKSVLDAINISDYHEKISSGFIVVGAMALGLGIVNILLIHGSKVVFAKKGWMNSFALISGLFLMFAFASLDWLSGLRISSRSEHVASLSEFAKQIKVDKEAHKQNVPKFSYRIKSLYNASFKAIAEAGEIVKTAQEEQIAVSYVSEFEGAVHEVSVLDTKLEKIDSSEDAVLQMLPDLATKLSAFLVAQAKLEKLIYEKSLIKHIYTLLNNGFFIALGSAMFSLLGFYIAAAAYRAFRIRSFESSLMMVAALIVILGQMSFSLRLYGGFAEWRSWLMNVPNGAAFRAIKIGASVAGLVLAFRMWFSLESESFSKEKE